MSRQGTKALRGLESSYAAYGPDAARDKLSLLELLAVNELGRARDVARLHDILCFLRAYPDDAAVLELVERVLEGFDRRKDLRRHAAELADTGIAGTKLNVRFFAPQAKRLAERWPSELSIDWKTFDNAAQLEKLLPLGTLYAERAAFDDPELQPRDWLKRFRAGRSDAEVVLALWGGLDAGESTRSAVYDALDPPLVFRLAHGAPSRTREKIAGMPVVHQSAPLVRARPDLAREARRPPRSVKALDAREAMPFIELARDCMLPRERDLEVFSYANPADVRLVDAGDGLTFACIGVLPERRSLLEAVYGFLMLKNGAAIGYALASALFESSEIAYNIFETFRGGETALVFARLLAAVRRVFGSSSFAIDPYQLGHHNKEGIQSGAFWFYQKLGFAPRRPEIVRALASELSAIAKDKRHRSSKATLEHLASDYVFFHGGRNRNDVLGHLAMPRVALHITSALTESFGSDRARARAWCLRGAAEKTGLSRRESQSFSAPERQAWERWAPLIATLPGIDAWSPEERRALVPIVRAKGAPIESEFVRHFDSHQKLRAAVRKLAL